MVQSAAMCVEIWCSSFNKISFVELQVSGMLCVSAAIDEASAHGAKLIIPCHLSDPAEWARCIYCV